MAEHLTALDALRQGIHLRGYAQKQPKQEYKREAFELWVAARPCTCRCRSVLMNVRIQSQEEAQQAEHESSPGERRNGAPQHADFGPAAAEEPADVRR